MITRSMFTPMSVAVSASWATARMPRPSRVRFTTWSSTIIITMAETITRIWRLVTSAPKKLNTMLLSRMRPPATSEKPTGLRLTQLPKASAMASDAPMAEMSAARRPAPRLRKRAVGDALEQHRGARPRTPWRRTAMNSSVNTSARPDCDVVMPSQPTAHTTANVPIMKISEWAKLMSRRTPYTSV